MSPPHPLPSPLPFPTTPQPHPPGCHPPHPPQGLAHLQGVPGERLPLARTALAPRHPRTSLDLCFLLLWLPCSQNGSPGQSVTHSWCSRLQQRGQRDAGIWGAVPSGVRQGRERAAWWEGGRDAAARVGWAPPLIPTLGTDSWQWAGRAGEGLADTRPGKPLSTAEPPGQGWGCCSTALAHPMVLWGRGGPG